MASYDILKNTPLIVNLPTDYVDSGWTVSENIAYHSGCNPGYIKQNFDLSSNGLWSFRYEVLSINQIASVRIEVGGMPGVLRTAPGIYVDEFNINSSDVEVRFFGDGVLALSLLQVFPPNEEVPGTTFMFNEDYNVFMPYLSYVSEMMVRFADKFLTFENGGLWLHNVNEVRNNFYGVQYPSIIQFYVNGQHEVAKNFYNIHVNSNKRWGAKALGDIFIYPYEGKANGQRSRLKTGNFRNYQGSFFADFQRNGDTPGHDSVISALKNGALLQGKVMEITLTNEDTTEVRLLEIEVFTTEQKIT